VPCFLCRIASGEGPASIVFADAATTAFVGIRQPNEGHILVVPRMHIETIDLLDQRSLPTWRGRRCVSHAPSPPPR
jgi:histidine triad (HIT) family protein